MIDENLTGRDHLIIAQSLYVAAHALRRQPHPPESNIADMERLLDTYYPWYAAHRRRQTEITKAIRRGLTPEVGRSLTEEYIREYLNKLSEDEKNVVDLFG